MPRNNPLSPMDWLLVVIASACIILGLTMAVLLVAVVTRTVK